jgi:hypothetical protein
MQVSVITFREEYLSAPRILAVFSNKAEAASVCSQLNEKYREIKDSSKDIIEANEEWESELIKNRIPSNQMFRIREDRLYNFAFESIEVDLVGEAG